LGAAGLGILAVKDTARMNGRLPLIALVAALLALALATPAAAQEPAAPDTTPQPSTPSTLPQDEDDEELGEEIPDEKPAPDTPESGTSGGGGGPPAREASPPAEARSARLPRTGGDPLLVLAAGMFTLGSGLVLWSRLDPT
jgi:hypothetical protein